MKIYEYKKGNTTLIYAERDDRYNGVFMREIEAKQTYLDLNKKGRDLQIGDVVCVNKYNARNNLIDFRAEIVSFDIVDKPISERLNECRTMNELDSLRLAVVSDKAHVIENQKLFIAAKRKVKRNKFNPSI